MLRLSTSSNSSHSTRWFSSSRSIEARLRHTAVYVMSSGCSHPSRSLVPQPAHGHLPSRLEISELCIFGLSWAIFLRCNRDHTMNAFIGRLMCSSAGFFNIA
uniref:Uncharacterized protein n=1 Tax=Anopheles melas TaxID=34690 RepID=A0A182U9W9_9DIPT